MISEHKVKAHRERGVEILAEYMPTEHRHQLGALDVALLLNTLERRGVDVEQLLIGTGLSGLDLRGPNGKLTLSLIHI